MGGFKDTIIGIIILGVISSLIATYIWERGITPIRNLENSNVATAPASRSDSGKQVLPGISRPRSNSVSNHCTSINNRDFSARVVVPPKGWSRLNRGDEAGGYLFSTDGALFFDGDMLSHNIPVSALSGRGDTEWAYAQSVKISPKTPDGKYALLQGCDQPNFEGSCWALFVLHLDTHRMERTSAGHYGITGDRVVWIAADDDYGIVRYQEGGQTMHYRIHLPTGQSTPCDSSVY
jgi:hypothetical protein